MVRHWTHSWQVTDNNRLANKEDIYQSYTENLEQSYLQWLTATMTMTEVYKNSVMRMQSSHTGIPKGT